MSYLEHYTNPALQAVLFGGNIADILDAILNIKENPPAPYDPDDPDDPDESGEPDDFVLVPGMDNESVTSLCITLANNCSKEKMDAILQTDDLSDYLNDDFLKYMMSSLLIEMDVPPDDPTDPDYSFQDNLPMIVRNKSLIMSFIENKSDIFDWSTFMDNSFDDYHTDYPHHTDILLLFLNSYGYYEDVIESCDMNFGEYLESHDLGDVINVITANPEWDVLYQSQIADESESDDDPIIAEDH